MTATRVTQLAISILIAIGFADRLSAQSASTEPRFVRPRIGASQPLVVIDPGSVPALQRQIVLALDSVSRADALRAIGTSSGITITFRNELVPGGAISLRRD